MENIYFFRCMFLVIYTFYSIACCTFSLLIFYRFHAKWLIATFEGTLKYYLSLHSALFCEYCECWTRIGGGVGCGDRGWGVVVCGPCNPPPPNHRVWEGLSGWLDWAPPALTPHQTLNLTRRTENLSGEGEKKHRHGGWCHGMSLNILVGGLLLRVIVAKM